MNTFFCIIFLWDNDLKEYSNAYTAEIWINSCTHVLILNCIKPYYKELISTNKSIVLLTKPLLAYPAKHVELHGTHLWVKSQGSH